MVLKGWGISLKKKGRYISRLMRFSVCCREVGQETKELRVRLMERNAKREREAFLDGDLLSAAVLKLH